MQLEQEWDAIVLTPETEEELDLIERLFTMLPKDEFEYYRVRMDGDALLIPTGQ